jgi:transposase-like protein
MIREGGVTHGKTGGKTIAEVTKEFDLTETALREWVKRAEAEEMERDIPKKATAFFAKENA